MAQARPSWSRLGVPEFVDHSATLLGKGIRLENAMLRRQSGAAVDAVDAKDGTALGHGYVPHARRIKSVFPPRNTDTGPQSRLNAARR